MELLKIIISTYSVFICVRIFCHNLNLTMEPIWFFNSIRTWQLPKKLPIIVSIWDVFYFLIYSKYISIFLKNNPLWSPSIYEYYNIWQKQSLLTEKYTLNVKHSSTCWLPIRNGDRNRPLASFFASIDILLLAII